MKKYLVSFALAAALLVPAAQAGATASPASRAAVTPHSVPVVKGHHSGARIKCMMTVANQVSWVSGWNCIFRVGDAHWVRDRS